MATAPSEIIVPASSIVTTVALYSRQSIGAGSSAVLATALVLFTDENSLHCASARSLPRPSSQPRYPGYAREQPPAGCHAEPSGPPAYQPQWNLCHAPQRPDEHYRS